ncbi:MAG: phosphoenolpyruvate--protein phosphotransferase [Candidatus Sumerlaeota bacterium]|nr:phosphoenolpyruvate--protein phosphotransferase [Candidatus Sumerlaeota bacterium]
MANASNASLEITGIGVSPGVVYGEALLIDKRSLQIEPRTIPANKIESEVVAFRQAIEQSRQQIMAIRRRVADVLHESKAQIYDSHLMILDDELIFQKTISVIRGESLNAEYAFDRSIKELAQRFEEIDDPYMRARRADLEDIHQRVLNNLLQLEHEPIIEINRPVIVVAHDLTPSDTANMIGRPVLAFVTDKGGPTSHAAIMAKALEIPAVVSAETVTARVKQGDLLLVDGDNGIIVISPTESRLRKAERTIRLRERQDAERERLRDLPAETRDGYRIELAANIEFPEEIPHVLSHGADGVGLFRTEFHYLNKGRLPEEEELYEVYSDVLRRIAPKPVIFRTVDLGGDKLADYMSTTQEFNPYLGLRAIRLCLANPEMFRTQLRAIIRASAHGPAKIMFPMITRVDEVRQARAMMASVRRELRAEGKPMSSDIEIGIMIEIPSAALTSDILAQQVDFFSIGTNDLIQYTMAVDRVNEAVAHLYEPYHPSVLRLISHVITSAHEAGIWVGVCGEMAADPMNAVLLAGMGVDELSMGSILIPEVKALLRSVTLSQARELAREVLRLPNSQKIRALIAKRRRQFRRAAH